MHSNRLIILGTGGSARVMAMIAESLGMSVYGFVGHGEPGTDLGAAEILGDDSWLLSQDFSADLIIGVGYPQIRASIAAKYQDERYGFPNLIHSTAVYEHYSRNRMGHGNILSLGCTLTCDITIGNYSLLNMQVAIGHDTKIGSCCVLNPNSSVSGNVTIGDRVLIGTGAQVLEKLTVGNDVTIGAGAVVIKDVPSGSTMVGIPAYSLAAQNMHK